jgi:acetyl-CoA acetyltransferase family protein
MGLTAENVAERFEVSREDQDRFALASHQKACKAIEAGQFKKEIVPVEIPQPDGKVKVFDTDECPRKDTALDKLAGLKPVFRADGTVTAGNSSPLNDGAAAVVLMSEKKAKELGIKPLARIVAMAYAGVEPEVMGIGPIPAVRKALKRANMEIGDIDIVELNEAFAAQSLAVVRELKIDQARLNPHGGGIALGHPLGATGARIMNTLIGELLSLNKTVGLETMCIGGGQGIATIVERI